MSDVTVQSALAARAARVGTTAGENDPKGPSFARVVADVLQEANAAQHKAEGEATRIAQGEGDIVEAMLALSKADLSLRYVVSLRNRAIEAYQEIMRLGV